MLKSPTSGWFNIFHQLIIAGNTCRWIDFPREIWLKLSANGMHSISPESTEPETLLIFATQCPPGLPASTRIDIGCQLASYPQSCRHWESLFWPLGHVPHVPRRLVQLLLLPLAVFTTLRFPEHLPLGSHETEETHHVRMILMTHWGSWGMGFLHG